MGVSFLGVTFSLSDIRQLHNYHLPKLQELEMNSNNELNILR